MHKASEKSSAVYLAESNLKIGLRKLSRSTHESLHKPDSRQESYCKQLDEFAQVHERLADNGMQFAQALNQMHEDLAELSISMERGRKHWKQFGLSSEATEVKTIKD